MHVSSSKSNGKKGLNFELNLVSFIDILSVCICFLLVTTVFMSLGSLHASQAIGDSKTQQDQKNQGSVSVSMGSSGEVQFQFDHVKSFTGRRQTITVRGQRGQIDFSTVNRWIDSFSKHTDEIKTVMIMPNPSSHYDDIIQLMARFKKNSIGQIGIAPL